MDAFGFHPGNEADAYETLRYISVLIFRIGKVYVIGL